ncbi:MAG: hypothetical protein IT381_30510 [Deltaproteobacteria bacterium]|nr:hypothetical protein [Deltaproteobacteria bacterium]
MFAGASPSVPTRAVEAEAKKLTPLRDVRYDEYVVGPSGSTYHGLAMRYVAPILATGSLPALPDVPKGGLRLATAQTSAGDKALLVGADGRLWVGQENAGGSGDEVSAIVMLAQQGLVQPFFAVNDAPTLQAIAGRLAQVHRALVLSPYITPPGIPADAAQVRAATLTLLLAAAVRAHALGAADVHTALARTFEERLAAEPNTRDFYGAQATAAAARGEAPAFASSAEVADVSKLPYAKWERDGVARLLIYPDDMGSPRTRVAQAIVAMDFGAEGMADGWTRFRPNETVAGELPIEIDLAPGGSHSQLLGRIDEDAVDGVVYTGHAGYGAFVDRLDATATAGDGKLIVILQCSGVHSANTIKQKLPAAQLVSTTASSNDDYDMIMLAALVAGVRKRVDWRTIHASTQSKLREAFPSADLSQQYFYPNQVERGETSVDRDRDGVSDERDSVFSSVAPTSMSDLSSVRAASPPLASYRLSGEALMRAVDNVALVLRNSHMLTAAAEAKSAWSASAIVAEGYFTPAAGQQDAFRFSFDAKRTFSVALSTHLSHIDEWTLSQMLALEAARFIAARAGLTPAQETTLALGMLERLVHQTAARYAGVLIASRIPRDASMLTRYGLDPGAAIEAMEAAQDPEDFEVSHLTKIGTIVTARGLRIGAAREAGRDLWRDGMRRSSWSADGLAEALGLPGQLSGEYPFYRWEHDGIEERLDAEMESGTGRVLHVWAQRFDFEVLRQVELQWLLVGSGFMPARVATLMEIYKQARRDGRDRYAAADRVAAAFQVADGTAPSTFLNSGPSRDVAWGWSDEQKLKARNLAYLLDLGLPSSRIGECLRVYRRLPEEVKADSARVAVACLAEIDDAAVRSLPIVGRFGLVASALAASVDEAGYARERAAALRAVRMTLVQWLIEENRSQMPALDARAERALIEAAGSTTDAVVAMQRMRRVALARHLDAFGNVFTASSLLTPAERERSSR